MIFVCFLVLFVIENFFRCGVRLFNLRKVLKRDKFRIYLVNFGCNKEMNLKIFRFS